MMKTALGGLLVLATLSGCASRPGAYMANVQNDRGYPAMNGIQVRKPPAVPGVMGAWGQPIPMRTGTVQSARNAGEAAARATFAKAMPREIVQQITAKEDMNRSGVPVGNIIRASGAFPEGVTPPSGAMGPPSGILPIAGAPGGAGPAMGLPGAGRPYYPNPVAPMGSGAPGAVAGVGMLTRQAGPAFAVRRTSIRFSAPNGMRIAWYAPTPDGKAAFTPQTLTVPARYNFPQAARYRLKLSRIPNHPDVELYPTLEVVPANTKTTTFLAHASVPLTFTEDDFAQVLSGNFLVKVVYLPFPQFQDLAARGIDEVSSARLEPGQDPIAEAQRRGHILLVVRMGNIDLEAPNTPPINQPGANQMARPQMPGMMPPGMMARPGMPMMMPGMMPPGMMMPPQMRKLPGAGKGTPTTLPPVKPEPKGPIGKAPTGQNVQQVSLDEIPASNGKPPAWAPSYLKK